jgi:putative peptide zinc metalloprotease protein
VKRLRNSVAGAFLAVLITAAPAIAQTTSAVAVNTTDGTSIFQLAFEVRRAVQSVVEPLNAAVAVSSCTECQTVAISIQIVLVMSDPSTFAPVNVALAYNENCTSCQTLASAYQFVVGAGSPVRLTREGRKQIAQIRRALEALRKQKLTIFEIQARVDALMQKLRDVLAKELVPVKHLGDGDDNVPFDGESPSPSASPEASAPGATGSPAETPSPSASASETPSASPSAS